MGLLVGLLTFAYLTLAANAAALAAAAAADASASDAGGAAAAALAKPGAMAHAAASTLVGEAVSDSLDELELLPMLGRMLFPEELEPIS